MERKVGFRSFVCGTVLAAVALAGGRAALAADAALIAAAKKEGEVIWYTTMIVNQVVRPTMDAFTAKYGIKVREFRANANDLAIKVINEGKAGRVQADVVDGTNTSNALEKEGLVVAWLPDAAKDYPAYLKDSKNFWIAQNLYVLTPAFNTDLVKPGTEPKTFADLLDPKWKGKITWSNTVSSSAAAGFIGTVLTAMGEKDGMEYLKKLKGQDIVPRSTSAREVVDQVMAGEHALALQIFNHHTVISAEKGAPVSWIPMEPATVNLQVASLLKGAPHPNAGKLLLDFMISEEGQLVFQKAGYLPAHPKIPASDPKLKPEGGNFQALYVNPAELDDKLAGWVKIYNDIFR